MFKNLKALFDEQIAAFAGSEASGPSLALAVSALLFEVSRADHEVDDAERAVIAHAVSAACDVPAEEIDTLLAEAGAAVDEAVSLYDFTTVVNEHFSHAQKYDLLLMLWRVAYADGRIDRYEDYFVRKIADLLHLSQREFIRAKHAAQA